jgi:hypothetical protein
MSTNSGARQGFASSSLSRAKNAAISLTREPTPASALVSNLSTGRGPDSTLVYAVRRGRPTDATDRASGDGCKTVGSAYVGLIEQNRQGSGMR